MSRGLRIKRLINEVREFIKLAGELISMDIDKFMADYRNRYTLRFIIVEIVEACVDIGLIILREKLGIEEVYGYKDVFRKLNEYGVISSSVYRGMADLVGLRNLIIHRYWDIDDQRIYMEAYSNGFSIVEKYLEEVERFAFKP
ncbi:MAG: DUF86 domain-containing protein [Desulfurococcales archaeon]|nr:DUF86 domain-containing protein [Desulfurococcales archaeon]